MVGSGQADPYGGIEGPLSHVLKIIWGCGLLPTLLLEIPPGDDAQVTLCHGSNLLPGTPPPGFGHFSRK